jgi:uncharacterized Zn-finger protein
MASKNVINKNRMLFNRTQGYLNQKKSGHAPPHRIYSAAMLSDSLDIVCKPFQRMAYIGDHPEVFFEMFKHGKFSGDG